MKGLDTVQKGIYSLDGFDLDNDSQPIIAVHPYFISANHPEFLFLTHFPTDYLEKFENLIQAHTGPIITLEERGFLKKTAKRYEQIGRPANRFLIPTFNFSAQPFGVGGDENFFNFVRSFKGKPAGLVGGILGRKKGDGCLGDLSEKLNNENIPT